jgi:Peptidase_C39 like family
VIALAGTLLLAASLHQPLSLLDVPFISQSEALCGGAAVSMVLRYWGETGVQAEDFASLVNEAAGGIPTADLVAAVQARGSAAVAAVGTPALAQGELAAGRPVIALIEDRPGALHYVVLVGWHARAVVFHDPARTPFVVMQPDEFERRWRAGRTWMMAIAPGVRSAATPADISGPTFDNPGMPTSCDELVNEGVRLAQRHDLVSAERMLAGAAYQCPGPAPLRELAGVRLLQRRWGEVRDLAERAVALDPADTHAWTLLATSRYISGNRGGALDAWNHASEPVIDLVSASGLQRTTHRTVERVLGLNVGEVLTRSDYARAERRLDELPAAFATRLEYVPRGSGRVEVRAHVAERPVVPSGRLTWAAIGARTAIGRELSVGIHSLSQRGERLEARWRFWPHRPAYGVSLSAPLGSRGLFTLAGTSEEQPFTAPEMPAAERAGARAQMANWATGLLRWEARAGIDRWKTHGTFGVAGANARVEYNRVTLTIGTDVWLGDTRFAVADMSGHWSSSRESRGTVVSARGGFQAIGANAPLDLWAGGDTGHARRSLLRAHPVLEEGRLVVQRLGRRLAHAGVEIQQWRRGPGPISLGIAGFLDTARTSRRLSDEVALDADAGVGLRVAIPGERGLFRVDIAHGLRDGRQAVSAVWQP